MDEAFLPASGPVDALDAGEAAFAASGTDVTTGAQDEAMQPVWRVGIILAPAVVHQHRQPERIAEPDARIDHRIVAGP